MLDKRAVCFERESLIRLSFFAYFAAYINEFQAVSGFLSLAMTLLKKKTFASIRRYEAN